MKKVDKALESMLEEHGTEAFIEEMWKVYVEWPNPDGNEKTVMRYNRKAILCGKKVGGIRLRVRVVCRCLSVQERRQGETVGGGVRGVGCEV